MADARRKPKTKPQVNDLVVVKAGLVGTEWVGRTISKTIYLMPKELCKDLTYWLRRRVAWCVSGAKPNGEGWSQLICWPGRGMFVVVFDKEVQQSIPGIE